MNEPKPYQTTVKDIYDKEFCELLAPNGFEFTGEFRHIKVGEYYLSKNDKQYGVLNCYVSESVIPLLVLKPKSKKRRLIFEQIDTRSFENSDSIYEGEYYNYCNDSAVYKCHSTFKIRSENDNYIIYNARKEEF